MTAREFPRGGDDAMRLSQKSEPGREHPLDPPHVFFVREAREGGPYFCEGGLEIGEEGRVLLHAVDEDEATRVLELALHREHVEAAAELFAAGAIEAPLGGVFVEAGLLEGAIERLVAVVEERHEVVDGGAEEGVLEVDPNELGGAAGGAAHHEVAALVVAVNEAAGPLGDAAREAIGDGVPCREGGWIQGLFEGVEAPLAEVIQLPAEELLVEGARADDGAFGEIGEGPLGAREVGDGAGVDGGAAFGVALEVRREGLVAEVLDEQEALVARLAVDAGDAHAALGEEGRHFEERPAGALGAGCGDLLGAGVGDEHRDERGGRIAGGRHAEVAARRGAAGHGRDFRRGGACGAGDEAGEGLLIEGQHEGFVADAARDGNGPRDSLARRWLRTARAKRPARRRRPHGRGSWRTWCGSSPTFTPSCGSWCKTASTRARRRST
jgi:hypothetical protein